MKYEIQKVENIIISDSENVTTNIHFFRQVHLVKPTSLRKEILLRIPLMAMMNMDVTDFH